MIRCNKVSVLIKISLRFEFPWLIPVTWIMMKSECVHPNLLSDNGTQSWNLLILLFEHSLGSLFVEQTKYLSACSIFHYLCIFWCCVATRGCVFHCGMGYQCWYMADISQKFIHRLQRASQYSETLSLLFESDTKVWTIDGL